MKERNIPKRAVLGVDAAWTERQPSGVARAVETGKGWRLAAVEASYGHFIERAKGVEPGDARPGGSKPFPTSSDSTVRERPAPATPPYCSGLGGR
jgi:hypothetical protein